MSTTPAANGEGVDLQPTVVLSFSGPLDCATVDAMSVTLTSEGNPVAVEVVCSGDEAIITASGPLPGNAPCTARVDTSVRGADGARLSAPFTFAFRTVADLISLAATMESRFGALRGDELEPATISDDLAPVLSYSMTALGFAFCEPLDPFAPPVADPLEGKTVYGCSNQTDVVAQVFGSEIDFVLTVPVAYFDLEGDLTPGGPVNGYMLATEVIATFTCSLEQQPNDRFRLGGVIAHEVQLGDLEMHSDSSLLDSLAAPVLQFFEPFIVSALEDVLVELAQEAAARAPEFVP